MQGLDKAMRHLYTDTQTQIHTYTQFVFLSAKGCVFTIIETQSLNIKGHTCIACISGDSPGTMSSEQTASYSEEDLKCFVKS